MGKTNHTNWCCRKCPMLRTMRFQDCPKPLLVVNFHITKEKRRSHSFMNASGRTCTSAATAATIFNPGSNGGIAIFVETTIVYRRLPSCYKHLLETLYVQIQTVLGCIFQKRVHGHITRQTRCRWRRCVGCIHDEDEITKKESKKAKAREGNKRNEIEKNR